MYQFIKEYVVQKFHKIWKIKEEGNPYGCIAITGAVKILALPKGGEFFGGFDKVYRDQP